MTEQRHAHQGLPDFKLHDAEHAASRRGVVRFAFRFALVVVLVLLAGLGRTLFVRWSDGQALAARATENATLHVRVIEPGSASPDERLTLPGTLLGIQEAQIYARTSGYVGKLQHNIGERVRKGELLAQLNTPELDRQVEEAGATFRLAKTAYERWSQLRKDNAVSQQELDEKTAAYRQSEAALQRLREQQEFGRIVAPFDGIVTRRNINVGDLVNAGNGGSPQALFALSETRRLHTYVYVPQNLAGFIHVGDSVDIRQADRPDRPLKARIARTAGAIDLATRTLQVDIEIDNADHALLPGSYVDVVLKAVAGGGLTLPTNTLLFSGAGPQVAVVVDGKIVRKAVALGTDYGRVVVIKSGVAAGDQVVVNPPDSIADGQATVIESPPAPDAAKAKP